MCASVGCGTSEEINRGLTSSPETNPLWSLSMSVKHLSYFAIILFVTTQVLSVGAAATPSGASGGVRLRGKAAGSVPPALQTDTRCIACEEDQAGRYRETQLMHEYRQ